MTEFFRSQLDYVFFIYGMSFFILAVACLLLVKIQEQKFPWLWLGIFGFAHALNEWLDMFAISLGDNIFFKFVRLAVSMLSFLALVEFSRRSLLEISRSTLSKWFYLPLLFCIYLGWYFGRTSGFSFITHYFLGFGAGLSAGIILFIYSLKSRDPQRKWIASLGVLIAMYSFTQLVITDAPAFISGTILNNDVFTAIFRFPVQLLRCLLAIAAAFILLTYWYLIQSWLDKDDERGRKRKKQVIFVGMVYAFLAALGWLITQSTGAYYKRVVLDEFIRKAKTISAAIDYRDVGKLAGSKADENTPEYIGLREQVMSMNKANGDLRFTYLTGYRAGQLVFLVDSEPVFSADYSPPGQVYFDASQGLKSNFYSKKNFIDGPYTDRWGTWISAFSPVIDPRTKEVIAVVGMDMDIKIWQQKIFEYRVIVIMTILVIFVLFVSFFVINLINRSANEKIIISQRPLQHLIDNIPSPVFYKNKLGVYLGCNNAFLEFFGFKKEQVIGKALIDLSPLVMADKHAAVDRELFNATEGGVKTYEVELLHADGTNHTVLLSKSTYPGPDGRVAGLIGVIHDISQRKHFEDELKLRNIILSTQQEASIDGILVVDNNRKVISFNRRFAEMCDILPEALETKSDELILKAFLNKLVDPDNFLKKVLYLYEHNHEVSRDEVFLKDGRVFDRYSSPMEGADGKYYGRVWYFRDITERKTMEEELRDSYKNLAVKVKERTAALQELNYELERTANQLRNAVKVKNEFLANMSHELRTPLNSINGFSEILYDETFGPLNKKQKEYINYVLLSGRHLLSLINDVLDMAKIEAGKMTLSLSSFPLSGILRDVAVMLKEMAYRKHIEMALELPDSLGNIEADERKVRQVAYNLISNAIKFTPEGGKIGIRMKKVEMGIEVEVWDTGIGFSQEDIAKAFQAFTRIESPYSRITEGTGLGLALSKKMIDLHGGRIWIESGGKDRGTAVRFVLPVRR
jgi:two-component system CheB/CheR fusion protein